MGEVNPSCTEPITCYAQSSSGDRIALAPNNNLVYIYKHKSSSWVEESVLGQHDLRVTSIDWGPKTNRIVTCSADRNAYVWVQQTATESGENGRLEVGETTWKPTLVLLRINRAATCVRWSPDENKFAVGTAAKLLCICYFESANDWWVSRHIKRPIKSTVTSIDWHHDNIMLACGSTDYKSRIFSTYLKEVDTSSSLAISKASTWSKHKSLSTSEDTNALVVEFSNNAWVHNVAFSPDGTKLAWVTHDSSISVADSTQNMTVATLRTRYLPFLTCIWVSQTSIIAAGHDRYPILINHLSQAQPALQFSAIMDESKIIGINQSKPRSGSGIAFHIFHKPAPGSTSSLPPAGAAREID